MANELRINDTTALSLSTEIKIEELIKPLKKEIFLTNSYIAGLSSASLSDEDDLFEEAGLSTELTLQRLPNGYSEDAIGVYGRTGKPLGYVADKDNEILARLMDAGKTLKAVVVGCMTEKNNRLPYVEIAVYLVDF